ncbi:MAG: permease [Lachnospiraceae bacterium]|nr:permease [Lachnospiraceae bacterium]MBR4768817.1 permease [Lachnospiraceae bacterium]
MEYLSTVVSSVLTPLFAVFLIAAFGYLIGGIKIKGISLGTAGVLVIALIYGIVTTKIGYTNEAGEWVSGAFRFGDKVINLFNSSVKANYTFVSNLGTDLFVTAVGLIAGPKFFRNFNKKTIGYVLMGVIVILTGAALTALMIGVFKVETPMALGLMTGALTSTPGLSAAKEMFVLSENSEALVTAGYGIAYLFGVLGVVFFVQLMPKFLKVNVEEEKKYVEEANAITAKADGKKRFRMDSMGFFPFMLTVVLGIILGSFRIPGINFSLGSSGGVLVMGLIVGHFGHFFGIDLSVDKKTLNFFRELGLCLFLIGAGVPGGANFIQNVKLSYFLFGIAVTVIPMIVGYVFGKYVFKFRIFNNLASITGGMTSTPALGTLISVAKTDEIAGCYAATYPIALVLVVLSAKIIPMIL